MRIRALALAALAGVMLAGCADSGGMHEPTVPGVLDLTVNLADDSTGAMLLSVTGGAVDSVVAIGTGISVAAIHDASGASVFVAGTLPGGATVAKVYVPDVRIIDGYGVQVTEAANRVTNAERSVLGMSVQALVTNATPANAPAVAPGTP